jgi:hypothetical protein
MYLQIGQDCILPNIFIVMALDTINVAHMKTTQHTAMETAEKEGAKLQTKHENAPAFGRASR